MCGDSFKDVRRRRKRAGRSEEVDLDQSGRSIRMLWFHHLLVPVN
jgi:hypothetical protein